MKQMIRAAAAVCMTLLFLATAVGAEQPAGSKAVAVDLEKTVGRYQEWTNRPSFPESVPFAYYSVYAMRALGKELPEKTRAKIIDFLKSCQKQDGGFVNEPKYAPASNVIYTYYALQTLELLGKPDVIDRKQALSFLLSLQQPEGGFKAAASAKEKSSLAATSYGVRALALLKKLDAVDKEKTAAYVAARQEKGKGFSLQPGTFSGPQPTFMAVRTLSLLGMLTDAVRQDVKAYLKDTRYAGQVSGRKYFGLPTMRDMSYVLRTLRDLSALDAVNRAKVTDFVESLYVDENGGFGPQPGYGTTPPSTYYGIVCLVQLGRLPDPLH